MKNLLALTFLSLTLIACGGDSDNGSAPPPQENPRPQTPSAETPEEAPDYLPEQKAVNQLTILDVAGQPVANADVEISPVAITLAKSSLNTDDELIVTQTDGNGVLALEGLKPGLYNIRVMLLGVDVSVALEITAESASEIAVVVATLSIVTEENGSIDVTDLSDSGIFVALGGVVYDEHGPLADVQVEVSAGVATNGAITTAVTNDNGEYYLIVNVSLEKLAAMRAATLRVYKPGYKLTQLSAQDFSEGGTIIGLNFLLTAEEVDASQYFSEHFDAPGSGVCADWQTQVFSSYSFGNNSMGSDVSDSVKSLWHQHDYGLNIKNQAVVEQLVVLAPDDSSEAYVPDPVTTGACWYGKAEAGDITQGNFIAESEVSENVSGALNGGRSSTKNAAALISPVIDLSHASAPLALNFRTWWEIESENPNDEGFDIMAIEYSLDEGQSWLPLARLNPLSDPVDLVERFSIPYSNRGYNKAPAWLWVEPMSLDELAGHHVQLRFVFNTQDEIYNGFRGWLIDDISITNSQGSFPIFQADVFAIDGLMPAQINTIAEDTLVDVALDVSLLTAQTGHFELVLIDENLQETLLLSQAITAEDTATHLSQSFNSGTTQWLDISVRFYDTEGELRQQQSLYAAEAMPDYEEF